MMKKRFTKMIKRKGVAQQDLRPSELKPFLTAPFDDGVVDVGSSNGSNDSSRYDRYKSSCNVN